MNEIKQIHLGRQAFTIAVDAHKELQDYLHAIEKAVGEPKQEVLEEVELRMAELLDERGIKGEKVILKSDVDYLKQQLGKPGDFAEDGEAADDGQDADQSQIPRRFFRDLDNAMLAGVASGLAVYFNVPVLLVRILFVAFTFTGGAAILIYVLLWLLVPAAKTPSEKLQMQGKAVTVDTLKEVIDNIDTKAAAAAASRAGYVVSGFVTQVLQVAGKILAGILGTGLLVAAAAVFLGAVITGVFILIGGQIGGGVTFPEGVREVALVGCAIAAAVLLSSIFLFAGISMFKRRWPVAGWIVGAIAGLFVLASGIATALAFDAVPRIHDRYDAMHNSQTVNPGVFKSLDLSGVRAEYVYEKSDRPSVEYRYYGKQDKKLGITTEVKNGVLFINASKYESGDKCRILCVFNDDRLEVVVRGPSIEAVKVDGPLVSFVNKQGFSQPKLQLTATGGSSATVALTDIDHAIVENKGGIRTLTVQGLKPTETRASYYGIASVSGNAVSINEVKDIEVNSNGDICNQYSPWLYVSGQVDKLVINGKQIDLKSLREMAEPGSIIMQGCVAIS